MATGEHDTITAVSTAFDRETTVRLSVDLGATNTVVVLSAHGMPPRVVEVDGSAAMPSAVFAEEDGELVVGWDAERRARLDPTRFEPNPKRRIDESTLLLGSDVVPVTEVLAAVLTRVLDETVRQLGGQQPEEVLLTHPADWGPERRNVLLSAARMAGMSGALSLVPEPVAASAHFASFPGKTLSPGTALAVYDLGAGTFDVAVVGATQNGYTVLAEDGVSDLGGLDIDQALLVHVGREVSHRDPQHWQRLLRPETTADRRTRRILQEDVKAAKEALSRLAQTEVPMPEPFVDVLVTRDELEALVRPSMLRSVELLASTVQSAGLQPEQLAGVYLVGGSSRLPLVESLLAEKLGVVPASLDQPETAVAMGAHHVTAEGISAHTQQIEGRAPVPGQQPPTSRPPAQPAVPYQTVSALDGSPISAGTPYPAPPPAPMYSGHPPQPTYFPHPGPGRQDRPRHGGTKLVIGIASVVVVALAAVLTVVFWPSSSTTPTYTAEECQKPGETDEAGFTDCLRQLAGDLPEETQCHPGMGADSTSASDPEELGVAVTCVAPEMQDAQVTYLHSESGITTEILTDVLLGDSQDHERVQEDWKGNGLEGTYSASADEVSSSLVFEVEDRPLVGFIMHITFASEGGATTPRQLADYFEETVQPGT